MAHIIAHEKIESRRLVSGNRLPRNFVEIVTCPFANTLVIGGGLHDARDVQVEESPKIDQLGPRQLSVTLQRNPGILLVTIEHQIILELCAHEPLMIV